MIASKAGVVNVQVAVGNLSFISLARCGNLTAFASDS